MERGIRFPTWLVVFNQNAANQSRLHLSEGGTLYKTKHLREAGHRGPYNNVQYLKNLFFEHYSMSTYSVTPNTQNNDL